MEVADNILHKKWLTQLYNYSSIIKLIITIHLYISNYPVLNMWYLILRAYNSNHSRCNNSIFIRTINFHNTITMMLGLAKFLTIRERRRFELISPAGNLFLTQTQVYQPR